MLSNDRYKYVAITRIIKEIAIPFCKRGLKIIRQVGGRRGVSVSVVAGPCATTPAVRPPALQRPSLRPAERDYSDDITEKDKKVRKIKQIR